VGCPGCVINATFCPSFTNNELGHLCADSLPSATSNTAYDIDVTFQMNNQLAYRANDTLPGFPFTIAQLQGLGFPITAPITVDVDTARLVSILGLPNGLSWEGDSSAAGNYYSLPTSGTACFKICGTTDCYFNDTTFAVTITIEYTQDLANLIAAFSGGGPFPIPFPSTQITSETYTLNLNISASTLISLDVVSGTGSDTITEGESITLNATTGFTSYDWSNGASTSSVSVSPLQDTTYTCTATDANGCEQQKSFSVFVEELPDTSSGIANVKRNDLFSMFPNPSSDNVYVEYRYNSNATLQIVNLQGKVLITEHIIPSERKKNITVSGYPKGIYVLQIKTEEGIQTEKLFIY